MERLENRREKRLGEVGRARRGEERRSEDCRIEENRGEERRGEERREEERTGLDKTEEDRRREESITIGEWKRVKEKRARRRELEGTRGAGDQRGEEIGVETRGEEIRR